jgi:hypothetical protein
MNLCRLNSQGTEQFVAYLGALRLNPAAPVPPELIDDPRFTEPLEPGVAIDRPAFESKYDAGLYLEAVLASLPSSRLRADVDLWAWLAIWFFDSLCPPDRYGRRAPKENAKYIPRPGDNRFGPDKHLLFFPWKMCVLHGERAQCFLAGDIGADTRAQREWTGYYLNVLTPVIDLGARLYGREGKLKPAATSIKRRGNLRRFVQVLKQLEVTYDIHGMTADEIQELLPRHEFNVWLG